MSLGNALGAYFTKQSKQAGSTIFAREGVSLTTAGNAESTATVRDLDGSVHRATITLNDERHTAVCTCAEMRGGRRFGYCKHLWATALAADHHVAAMSQTLSSTMRLPAHPGRQPQPSAELQSYVRDLLHAVPRTDSSSIKQRRPRPVESPVWKQMIARIESNRSPRWSSDQSEVPVGTPFYVLDLLQTRSRGRAILKTYVRSMLRNGTLGRFRPLTVNPNTVHRVESPEDKLLIGFLAGLQDGEYGGRYSGYYNSYYNAGRCEWAIDSRILRSLLPALQQSGRFCCLAAADEDPRPLQIDSAGAWDLALCLTPANGGFQLSMQFIRGNERVAPSAFSLIIPGSPGACLSDGRLAELDTFGLEADVIRDYAAREVFVPTAQAEGLVQDMLHMHHAPRLELPDAWTLTTIHDLLPSGQLELTMGDRDVKAELSYRYGDCVVPGMRESRTVIDAANRRQVYRNPQAEEALLHRLHQVGVKTDPYDGDYRLPIKRMPEAVRELSSEGWAVLSDGQLFRKAGEIEIAVTSGIDWFDVDAAVDFGGVKIRLPMLLKALRAGQKYVKLSDGTLGMLPEEWLSKHGALLELATVEGEETVRFANTQVLLLDAMLAEQTTVRVDEIYSRTREQLLKFDGIRPAKPSKVFQGTLRPYQEQGLGWMSFLEQFNWGGCLADDMGLGKTVQVLAFLASRKEVRKANGKAAANADATANAVSKQASPPAPTTDERQPMTAGDALQRVLRGERVTDATTMATSTNGNGHAPSTSLVVVPKSLVHNWLAESHRFTPSLNVLVYHGSERHEHLPRMGEQDLIVTTYHTLRNDIAEFAKREFDYVILDEAQSIKNAKAQIAKAVRLLKSRRRLALSGTPVENQLSDLWSLFEFLNPGMLGAMPAFKGAFASGRESTREGVVALRRALRPFMLRRTKEQVATDLPAKTEETLWCEMTASQQKRYDELRTYYRAMVLGKVTAEGLARSKIQVLEALLRLRQAACHPRLLDEKIAAADSGKAEALIPMLKEIMEGGHKALVFSQFTSFLAIIRKLLDDEKISYEYLDGATRDRQQRVLHFQSDPQCRLFLISLKAGGLGLNLTAADYVFILDPWWNPAVEAQAIDRTHRIGQDKKVIAYRMIARGTVEEKILELQNRKRDLAAAIITEANSLIADLTREDLEILLS